MKTYYFSNKSASTYSLIGLLSILMASCSSYQSASYDSDGVYSDSQRRYPAQASSQSNGYSEYFRSLQNDPEFFTDTQNYTSP
ncbi:MAG TPA: hypothetical protein VFR70_00180, partial [Flavobacterium sp.]|nr:hypothetical protein [Flavobacterium sp.]